METCNNQIRRSQVSLGRKDRPYR